MSDLPEHSEQIHATVSQRNTLPTTKANRMPTDMNIEGSEPRMPRMVGSALSVTFGIKLMYYLTAIRATFGHIFGLIFRLASVLILEHILEST